MHHLLKEKGVIVIPALLRETEMAELRDRCSSSTHHDDQGHSIYDQRNRESLASIASVLSARLKPHVAGRPNVRFCGVDPLMKLYRLEGGAGAVEQHRDQDYPGPNGSIASMSLLVHLNAEYTGGKTLFEGDIDAPRLKTGDGILFPHDLLHEGEAVETGVKLILKSDLFFRTAHGEA